MHQSLSRLSRISSLLILSGFSFQLFAGGMEPAVAPMEGPSGHVMIGAEGMWVKPNASQLVGTNAVPFGNLEFSNMPALTTTIAPDRYTSDYLSTILGWSFDAFAHSFGFIQTSDSNDTPYAGTWALDLGYMFSNESFIKGHWRQMDNIDQTGKYKLVNHPGDIKRFQALITDLTQSIYDAETFPIPGDRIDFDWGGETTSAHLTSSDQWSIKMADIMFGQRTHPTDNLILDYSAGAAYLDYTATFVSDITFNLPEQATGQQAANVGYFAFKEIESTINSSYTGWGPRLAMDATYHVSAIDRWLSDTRFNIGIVGGVGTSFYFGDMTSNTTNNVDSGDNPEVRRYVSCDRSSSTATGPRHFRRFHSPSYWLAKAGNFAEGAAFNSAQDKAWDTQACKAADGLSGVTLVAEVDTSTNDPDRSIYYNKHKHYGTMKGYAEARSQQTWYGFENNDGEVTLFKAASSSDTTSRMIPELDGYAGVQVGYDVGDKAVVQLQVGWKAFHFMNLDASSTARAYSLAPEFERVIGVNGPYAKLDFIF